MASCYIGIKRRSLALYSGVERWIWKRKLQSDPTSTLTNFRITFPYDLASKPVSQYSSVSVVTELHRGRPRDRFWASGRTEEFFPCCQSLRLFWSQLTLFGYRGPFLEWWNWPLSYCWGECMELSLPCSIWLHGLVLEQAPKKKNLAFTYTWRPR